MVSTEIKFATAFGNLIHKCDFPFLNQIHNHNLQLLSQQYGFSFMLFCSHYKMSKMPKRHLSHIKMQIAISQLTVKRSTIEREGRIFFKKKKMAAILDDMVSLFSSNRHYFSIISQLFCTVYDSDCTLKFP